MFRASAGTGLWIGLRQIRGYGLGALSNGFIDGRHRNVVRLPQRLPIGITSLEKWFRLGLKFHERHIDATDSGLIFDPWTGHLHLELIADGLSAYRGIYEKNNRPLPVKNLKN